MDLIITLVYTVIPRNLFIVVASITSETITEFTIDRPIFVGELNLDSHFRSAFRCLRLLISYWFAVE